MVAIRLNVVGKANDRAKDIKVPFMNGLEVVCVVKSMMRDVSGTRD